MSVVNHHRWPMRGCRPEGGGCGIRKVAPVDALQEEGVKGARIILPAHCRNPDAAADNAVSMLWRMSQPGRRGVQGVSTALHQPAGQGKLNRGQAIGRKGSGVSQSNIAHIDRQLGNRYCYPIALR